MGTHRWRVYLLDLEVRKDIPEGAHLLGSTRDSDEEGVGLGPSLPGGYPGPLRCVLFLMPGSGQAGYVHGLCSRGSCFKSEDMEAQKA